MIQQGLLKEQLTGANTRSPNVTEMYGGRPPLLDTTHLSYENEVFSLNKTGSRADIKRRMSIKESDSSDINGASLDAPGNNANHIRPNLNRASSDIYQMTMTVPSWSSNPTQKDDNVSQSQQNIDNEFTRPRISASDPLEEHCGNISIGIINNSDTENGICMSDINNFLQDGDRENNGTSSNGELNKKG